MSPPSGNTLKNIEKECCAKIMIRGKGSVKEGKVGRKDGQMLPGEDEPLHALVTANTMENVKKAVEQVSSAPFLQCICLSVKGVQFKDQTLLRFSVAL